METMTIEDTFKKVVKGKNFMTPNILKYVEIGKYIVEVSYGNKLSGEGILYGITVVDTEKMEHNHTLSTCATNNVSLEYYLDNLRKMQ